MKSKAKKILIIIPIVLVALPLLAAGIFGIYFAVVTKDAKLNKNLLPTASATPIFYDANGNEIPYYENGKIEPSEIPDNLFNAFVAIEDKRFLEHKGIDYRRVFGAMLSNVKAGGAVEGASTITQQLVKNTHLTQEKSLNRKLKEMVIARQVEKEYSKDDIMAMYLSVIYFGGGTYGVKDAAKRYFSKSLDELTLSECAALAGTVKNPSRYAPDKERATSRKNLVLKLMLEQGKISEKDYETAKSETIIAEKDAKQTVTADRFYISCCLNEIKNKLNVTSYELNNMGLKIYTYYEPKIQETLIRSLKSNVDGDSAGIVLDNLSGGVMAYFSTTGVEPKRQAGSSLKPLAVFAPALNENLIYPISPVKDEKISYGNYSPKNYGNKYYGWTTIEEGVKKSMNSVALKTLSYLTPTKAAAYLKRMNFDVAENDENLALALGSVTKGITPKQLADGYKTLANGGLYSKSNFVSKVLYQNDEIFFKNDEKAVFDEESAYLMTDMLVKTAQSGTAKTLSVLPYSVASKTGTAAIGEQNTDAVNASYTLENTVVCWQFGKGISSGGGGKLTVCVKEIYENLYDGYFPEDFPMPSNVKSIEIDDYALKSENRVKLASNATPAEYRISALFKNDNTPKEVSTVFDVPKLSDFKIERDCYSHECKISFEATSVYGYNIYQKSDGEKTLLAKITDKNGCVTVQCIPSSSVVEFSIIPYCIATSVNGSEITKKVIFD